MIRGRDFLQRNPDEPALPFFCLARVPNENKLFDCSRYGDCFTQQDDAWTLRSSREAGEVTWHRPPILADEYASGLGRDPQDLRIAQTRKSSVGGRAEVDFGHCSPQSTQDAPVQIGVSLESDSLRGRAAASQSSRR